MLSQLSSLIAVEDRPIRTRYIALTGITVIVKAISMILLVPLLGALFSPQPQDTWAWLAVFSLTWFITVQLDARINRLGAELGFGVMRTVQRSLVMHLGQLPLGWFQAQNTGAAREALATSGPTLASLVMNVVTPMVNAMLLPAAIAVGLFAIAPLLGLIASVATALLWAALQAGSRLEKKSEQAFSDANAALNERVIEFARTQPVLRANNQTNPGLSAAGSAIAGSYNALGRLLVWQIPAQLMFSFVNQLALISLASAAIWLTLNGSLFAPECVAVIVVIVRFLEPFGVLGELSVAITGSRRTLSSIHAMLDAPILSKTQNAAAHIESSAAPVVEFSGVGFSYPGAVHQALSDINFRVPAGSITAIVGPSGSGKSTILSLLARFFDPQQGKIMLDGVDIREMEPQTLLKQVSAIWQDVFLFDGSIRDNIVVGAVNGESVTDSELARVAELSGVTEIINRLPQGWQTRVGEGGSTLSGGEKQRVSIARALLKPASILLVDEATSALDNQNQNVVASAITSQAGRCTVLVVAHQVSTIKDADYILFVDHGRVVEHGTIDALTALNGRFAQYWQQRQDSVHWRIK